MRFKASHVQCDVSAHTDSVAGYCAPGKNSRALIRSTIAAVSIKPSARSVTPLNWGLSAVVNSCFIPRDLHRSLNFPPRNSPPLFDRTTATLEGTPSARVSARNYSNISPASDLWRIKYTHAYREKSSRTMRVYRFLPRDSTTFSPLKNTKTLPSVLSARVYMDCLIPFRRPFAMEHHLHSSSFPSRAIP